MRSLTHDEERLMTAIDYEWDEQDDVVGDGLIARGLLVADEQINGVLWMKLTPLGRIALACHTAVKAVL